MEYKSSYDRINNINDIDYISRKICYDYGFDKYTGYQLIEIGYEDFNYILNTETNKYVVKILNTERDLSSCNRLITILSKSIKEGVPVPNIYSINNQLLYEINVQDTLLRLFVMEYSGKSFWELGKELNDNELKQVAFFASKINSIDYNIKETFYDEWTVTNLLKEYDKKQDSLLEKDKKIIQPIIHSFKNIDFDKLPYSYVHGDIIKANLLLDDNNNISVIDFSAFNYLPRIVEVTALLLGLCLTDERETTINKMNQFLSYYHNLIPLSDLEIEYLPLLLRSLASMYIIQTSFIVSESLDYVENEYWLLEGRKYLDMDINKKDLQFIKKM